MTPHIPEEFSTRLIDWSPFVIMGNTMPPRDPDEDEEDEDEDEEEEDRADEPPVVREPDDLSNVITFSQEDGIKKAPHFAGLSLIYLLMPEPGLELSADWCQMNTPTGRSISSLFDPFGGECEQKRRSNH